MGALLAVALGFTRTIDGLGPLRSFKLSCLCNLAIRKIHNGMVSYAAPNKPPEVFLSVGYRVTLASVSNPVLKMGVPPVPCLSLGPDCFVLARNCWLRVCVSGSDAFVL